MIGLSLLGGQEVRRKAGDQCGPGCKKDRRDVIGPIVERKGDRRQHEGNDAHQDQRRSIQHQAKSHHGMPLASGKKLFEFWDCGRNGEDDHVIVRSQDAISARNRNFALMNDRTDNCPRGQACVPDRLAGDP